ncbi:MAG: Transposase [Mitsuokella multacida]|jgi:transposase
MAKHRKTTQAERQEIVDYCLNHDLSYGETALKYDVAYQQVYQWVRKHKKMGGAGLEDRRGHRAGTMPSRTPEEKLRDELAKLKRENHWLQMENTVLKKLKEPERRDASDLPEGYRNTKPSNH